MRVEIVLTTLEDAKLVSRVIGHTHVRQTTDYEELYRSLARKHFGEKHNVRRDHNLFGWVAVSGNGDTITLDQAL